MNQPKHDNRRRWLPWAVVGAGLLFLGLVGGVVAAVNNPSSAASTVGSAGSATTSSCDASSIADQVLPSVVTIHAMGAKSGGTGSGEIIRSDGYILTNNHVIAIAANGGKVEVQFADGRTIPATITGRDPQTDLAVIKVSDESPNELRVIQLGESSSVRVGAGVVVLGAPLGLSNTVTAGIVSALDRTIQVPAENDSTALLVSAVQTDAAINPGNSGGSMVNCGGQLIGVPTAGATVPISPGESSAGSIGLGFAIPVDVAKTISDEIITTGTVTHSFFGVATVPVPAAAVAQGQLPQGLYVQEVVPGGPSAQAGLRPGDVITAINGEPATSNTQLQEITLTARPGEKVTLDYSRDGRAATATITLGTQP